MFFFGAATASGVVADEDGGIGTQGIEGEADEVADGDLARRAPARERNGAHHLRIELGFQASEGGATPGHVLQDSPFAVARLIDAPGGAAAEVRCLGPFLGQMDCRGGGEKGSQ